MKAKSLVLRVLLAFLLSALATSLFVRLIHVWKVHELNAHSAPAE